MTTTIKNINTTNDNFDMQALMNIVGQSALTTNQISQQMGIVTTKINDIQTKCQKLEDRMDNIEYNEEVTTNQVDTITDTAKRRVLDIIGNSPDDQAKYFRSFIKKCYSEAKAAGLNYKIARTKKGDFQRIINYIEAWTPNCGCVELKRRVDVRAEANRNAKANGYD